MNARQYGSWLSDRIAEVTPRLTDRQLAEMIGVTHTYIGKLRRGQVGLPDEHKIDAIAKALEGFLGRPMVNESRKALGLPTLDDQAAPVPAPIQTAPDTSTLLDVVSILRSWPPEWRQTAVALADDKGLVSRPVARKPKPSFKTRETTRSLAAVAG